MTTPVASRLVLLADLPDCKSGDKVRFLGCVRKHDPRSGNLDLENELLRVQRGVTVRLNLDHVLESMSPACLQIGAWVHVMGYVVEGPDDAHPTYLAPQMRAVYVQAILLWDAGAINVAEYEIALAARVRAGGLSAP